MTCVSLGSSREVVTLAPLDVSFSSISAKLTIETSQCRNAQNEELNSRVDDSFLELGRLHRNIMGLCIWGRIQIEHSIQVELSEKKSNARKDNTTYKWRKMSSVS